MFYFRWQEDVVSKMFKESRKNTSGSSGGTLSSNSDTGDHVSLHHSEHQECKEDFVEHIGGDGQGVWIGLGVQAERFDGEATEWEQYCVGGCTGQG